MLGTVILIDVIVLSVFLLLLLLFHIIFVVDTMCFCYKTSYNYNIFVIVTKCNTTKNVNRFDYHRGKTFVAALSNSLCIIPVDV